MLDLEYSMYLSTPCVHHIIFAWNRPTNSWGIYAAKCAHFTIQKGINQALFSHNLQDLESNGVVNNGQCM